MPRALNVYREAQQQGQLLTPQLILPSLIAWFDATRLGAGLALGANNAVSSITDRIGGRVATVLTGAPTWVLSARNGCAAMKFSGAQVLSFTPTGFPTTTSPSLILFSGYSTASGGAFFTYGLNSDSPTTGSVRSMNASPNCAFAAQANDYNTQINGVNTDLCLITRYGEKSTTSIEVDVNGLINTGNLSSALSNPAARGLIGAYTSGFAQMSGFVHQILVAAPGAQMPTDRQVRALEGWDSWYTGRAGSNLAASHPFKNRPPMLGD